MTRFWFTTSRRPLSRRETRRHIFSDMQRARTTHRGQRPSDAHRPRPAAAWTCPTLIGREKPGVTRPASKTATTFHRPTHRGGKDYSPRGAGHQASDTLPRALREDSAEFPRRPAQEDREDLETYLVNRSLKHKPQRHSLFPSCDGRTTTRERERESGGGGAVVGVALHHRSGALQIWEGGFIVPCDYFTS